jgi:hypothetical protein
MKERMKRESRLKVLINKQNPAPKILYYPCLFLTRVFPHPSNTPTFQYPITPEKFEDYADIEYAVVLLNGDDRGASKEKPYENQKLRARQNVIFELGYFIGKLGRERFFVLNSTDVEIPSGYSGFLFTALDGQSSWRIKLVKEMQEAGLPVDMNRFI